MQKSVLIVEDEYLIAMDLQDLLEASGWHVMGPVATVIEALKLLAIELPAVALLDVNLAGELVTPVAEALAGAGVPFAIASAYRSPEQFGGAVLAGVPNVGKPAREARVISVLSELVNA